MRVNSVYDKATFEEQKMSFFRLLDKSRAGYSLYWKPTFLFEHPLWCAHRQTCGDTMWWFRSMFDHKPQYWTTWCSVVKGRAVQRNSGISCDITQASTLKLWPACVGRGKVRESPRSGILYSGDLDPFWRSSPWKAGIFLNHAGTVHTRTTYYTLCKNIPNWRSLHRAVSGQFRGSYPTFYGGKKINDKWLMNAKFMTIHSKFKRVGDC